MKAVIPRALAKRLLKGASSSQVSEDAVGQLERAVDIICGVAQRSARGRRITGEDVVQGVYGLVGRQKEGR